MTSINNNKVSLVKTANHAIAAHNMFQPGDNVLVCVSGGPDSIALLHILHTLSPALKIKLGIAHFNHMLRDGASEKDALFVENTAVDFGLPFFSERKNVHKYRREKKMSVEEAARHFRYHFFFKIAKKSNFNKIALGHHMDDNAELILMYLLRGSGALGSSGIPAVRDEIIVRPLITSTKTQILEFITSNDLKVVVDQSNKDTRYLRNSIRHQLIPLLKSSYNPNIVETLNRFGSIIKSEDKWFEENVAPLYENAVSSQDDDRITFLVSYLRERHISEKRRIIRKGIKVIKGDLKRISYDHIDSVISLLEAQKNLKRLDLPGQIRIVRNYDALIIAKEKQPLRTINKKKFSKEAPIFNYEVFKEKYATRTIGIKESGVLLKFSQHTKMNLTTIYNTGKKAALLDLDKLLLPIFIRNISPGDRFSPLGVHGTQKVCKYFKDRKIPLHQRLKCPIVMSKDKVIWVAGYQIDDSVKVTESTRKILKIELFLA